MHIMEECDMTPDERRKLQELDDMVLGASPDELRRIQQVDYRTQGDGLPFYDVCVDSAALVSGRYGGSDNYACQRHGYRRHRRE